MSQRTQTIETYLANEVSGLAVFSTNLGHIFGGIVGNAFEVIFKGKKTSQTKVCLQSCPHTLSHDIHGSDLIQ